MAKKAAAYIKEGGVRVYHLAPAPRHLALCILLLLFFFELFEELFQILDSFPKAFQRVFNHLDFFPLTPESRSETGRTPATAGITMARAFARMHPWLTTHKITSFWALSLSHNGSCRGSGTGRGPLFSSAK